MAGLKDPVYRARFVRWMWQPLSLVTLGILISLKGPTFPDLQRITGTDKEMASFFFMASACGYLVGSFLAGLIHGKIDNNILMAVTLIMAGVVNVWIPYCSHFPLMLFSQCLASIFCGTIDTSVSAEHMRIWGIQGQALLQFSNFAFGFGGIISPIFAEPFLSRKEMKLSNETQSTVSVNFTNTSDGELVNGSPDGLYEPQLHSNGSRQTEPFQTSNVHYAFLIAGMIAIATAIPFLVMIFVDKKSKRQTEDKYGQEPPRRTIPTYLYVIIASLLCAFYVMYVGAEAGFSFYVMTFVTEEYEQVSTADGAYITSFFWASFSAGRFAMIFVSKWVNAVRLLYFHLFLMLSAFTGFLVSAYYAHIDALKGFTCLIGIATSAVFPLGFSWTESELLMVTGRISGVFFVGSSIGAMIVFYLVGFLMQNESNMWFCYILLGSVVFLVVLFLLLLLLNRYYINKKYGTVSEGKTKVIEIISPLHVDKS